MKPVIVRLSFVLATAMAWPTVAQTPGGLSLSFDGVARNFAPIMEGARTGFTRFLTVDAVSIEGAEGPGRLVVELSLPPGARTGDQPHDARISFRPDGWRDYWVWSPDRLAGELMIEQLDLSGPHPRIVGHFEAALCFAHSPVNQPDPDRCLPASGRFDTPLVRD